MAAKLLLNKVSFVTGAGSGIGRATCEVLAREGSCVIAVDRNEDAAKDTVQRLKFSEQKHIHFGADVCDQKAIAEIFQSAQKLFKCPPTVIVNSAGITMDNLLLNMDINSFETVVDVNLKGSFIVLQAAARAMIESKVSHGSIVNVASIIGDTGNIGQGNYAASKAGIEALTKTAAKEFGKFGVRCNAVLPGFVVSPMTDKIPDKLKEKFRSGIALGRFGLPEEIAEVIAFLGSDRSSYVNGACIKVIGG